jgi:hypothetical protein
MTDLHVIIIPANPAAIWANRSVEQTMMSAHATTESIIVFVI